MVVVALGVRVRSRGREQNQYGGGTPKEMHAIVNRSANSPRSVIILAH